LVKKNVVALELNLEKIVELCNAGYDLSKIVKMLKEVFWRVPNYYYFF